MFVLDFNYVEVVLFRDVRCFFNFFRKANVDLSFHFLNLIWNEDFDGGGNCMNSWQVYFVLTLVYDVFLLKTIQLIPLYNFSLVSAHLITTREIHSYEWGINVFSVHNTIVCL